jgi:O-antigen/teichoic acid export membrane protein
MNSSPADPPGTASERKRRVGRSLLWVVSEKGGVTVVSLVSVALLTRLLTPDQMGVAAIGLTLVQILTALLSGPLHDAVVQRKDCLHVDISTAFWMATGLGVTLAALGFALAPLVSRAFADPRVGPVYAWMGLSLIAAGAEAGLAAPLRRALHFRPLAMRAMASRTCAAVVAVGMACAALLAIATPRLPGFAFSAASARWQLRYTLPTLGTAVLNNLQARIVVLFVGQVFGTTALGYVHVAQRVVQALRDFSSTAFYQLALPLLARHQGDRAALANGFRRATALFTAAVLPLFVGIAAVAPDVIGLAFGARWHPAVLPLQLLALSVALGFVRRPAGTVFQAAGRPVYGLIGTAISLAVTLAGLFTVGLMGVAWTLGVLVVRPLFTLPVGARLLQRLTGLGLGAQLRPALGPVLASALMAAVVLAATPLLAPWSASARLATLVALGAAVYLPLLWLLARGAVKEGEALARAALGPARP